MLPAVRLARCSGAHRAEFAGRPPVCGLHLHQSTREIMMTMIVTHAIGLLLLIPVSPAQEPQPARSRVTLIGCVENETDYRKRTGKISSSTPTPEKDFVLTSAKPAGGAQGVSGDFALNGKLEPEFRTHVGTRVEVVGFISDLIEHELPDGTLVLRPLVITSWSPSSGSCTSQ
jgi:hypothetical protein